MASGVIRSDSLPGQAPNLRNRAARRRPGTLSRIFNGVFPHLSRGAFASSTPEQAYFVKCDAQTTTQADINSGIVNLEVGFAPLMPAEFVILNIRQKAGEPA